MRPSGSSRLARRRRTIVAVTAGGLVLLFAAGLAFRALQSREASHAFAIPGEDGGGRRIVVEVLNTTDVQGLARATTLKLRRRGFDVVYFGSGGDAVLDSTIVVVRSAEPGARGQAARMARLLGLPDTRIRVDPDSTRLVDLSVLVGRDLATRVDLHP